MFGARPNLNPSRPCAGRLKVDWNLHPPIFAARGVVSILQVKFPVGFYPSGLYKFCWLLIRLTLFEHENPTWWNLLWNKATCVCNLLHNIQGLGPSPLALGANNMMVVPWVITPTLPPTNM